MGKEKFESEYFKVLSIWIALGKATEQPDMVARAENAITTWRENQRTGTFVSVDAKLEQELFTIHDEWFKNNPVTAIWIWPIIYALEDLTSGLVRSLHDDRFLEDVSDLRHICDLMVSNGEQQVYMSGVRCSEHGQVTVREETIEQYLADGFAKADLVRAYTKNTAEKFVTSLASYTKETLYPIQRDDITRALREAQISIVSEEVGTHDSLCDSSVEAVEIYYDHISKKCFIPSVQIIVANEIPSEYTDWGPRRLLEAEDLIPKL